MTSDRRIALIAGVLFIITFVASIPAVILYDAVLHDPNYIIGPDADWMVSLGALLEFVTGIANIGTAVVLYPIVKRQNESVALGYVASRIVESAFIVVGVFSLLSIVSLRQAFAAGGGANAEAFVVTGRALVAFHDWTFLLGPAFLAAIGNGMLLGYLMFTSRLVPRGMAVLGLIGGPLLLASSIAVLFGLHAQLSLTAFIATIPEILWEGSLGIWLTVRGFSPSPILPHTDTPPPRRAPRPRVVV